MSLEKLASKYIVSTEQVLEEMEIVEDSTVVDRRAIIEIVEHAKAYLEDSKYYRDQKKFEVSLASVAYSEGLLDTLRILGVVNFKWPERRREE